MRSFTMQVNWFKIHEGGKVYSVGYAQASVDRFVGLGTCVRDALSVSEFRVVSDDRSQVVLLRGFLHAQDSIGRKREWVIVDSNPHPMQAYDASWFWDSVENRTALKGTPPFVRDLIKSLLMGKIELENGRPRRMSISAIRPANRRPKPQLVKLRLTV